MVASGAAPARVLVVAGDAGGASALVPVLHRLGEDPSRIVNAFAYGPGQRVWEARGIGFSALAPDGDMDCTSSLLEGVDLLLVGTSANAADHERRLTAAARRAGVPSLALLDYWNAYRRRFGEPEEWPDRIAIMDQRAREEMLAEGFDADRLVVTGQPALDEVFQWRAQFTRADRERLRDRAGVQPNGLLLLYASAPALYTPPSLVTDNARDGSHDDIGYDTFSVLRLVIDALEQLATEQSRPITLLIRPHPRETADSFHELTGERLTVRVDASGHGRDWALAADVVSGTTSMLLVEACYLGRPTISLQPGTRRPDPLPTNSVGLSVPIYRSSEVLPGLRRLLFDSDEQQRIAQRLTSLEIGQSATDCVLATIREMTTK